MWNPFNQRKHASIDVENFLQRSEILYNKGGKYLDDVINYKLKDAPSAIISYRAQHMYKENPKIEVFV